MALVQPNFISTKILPGLSLASTKTQNKGYRPTTTIMMCKYYQGFLKGRPVFSPPMGAYFRRGFVYGAKISVEYYYYSIFAPFPLHGMSNVYRV